ncbi:MAG TPA: universal stress protein [Geomonas sp.]|nr:universal stress protein [Geomonas sp.]
MKFKRILAISRISEDCRDIVHNAIALAKGMGAELQVLHLISNPVDQEALNAPVPFPDGRHKTYMSIQEETKEELDKILKKELKSGFPIKLIIKDGDPVEDVINVVREQRIDLLLILSHEEGRLEHMLFGQENDAIIRRMPCSILLVKNEPQPVVW